MKEIFWIAILLGVFALGYLITVKMDRFVNENRWRGITEGRRGQSRVRLAAETPELLDEAEPVMRRCANAMVYTPLPCRGASTERLLKKLRDGRLDIVLLRGENVRALGQQYAFLPLPDVNLPSPTEEEERIYAVWKRGAKKKSRDGVIFALENAHRGVKTGYADYLR